MSETFEKVLVKDDRLGCITSKVKFQVLKGWAEHYLPALQSRLSNTSLPRVQRYGAKFRNYYKQRGAMAVDGHPQDLSPRQGCK